MLDGAVRQTVVKSKLGHGSFITVDFAGDFQIGRVGVLPVGVRGGLADRDVRRGHCFFPDPREALIDLVPQLNDRVLTAVAVERPSLSTVFTFGGLRLRTFRPPTTRC